MGSARVSRAGERVLAIANFAWQVTCDNRSAQGKIVSRDAETSTRNACATQTYLPLDFLRPLVLT
jgi:hypothetical protein